MKCPRCGADGAVELLTSVACDACDQIAEPEPNPFVLDSKLPPGCIYEPVYDTFVFYRDDGCYLACGAVVRKVGGPTRYQAILSSGGRSVARR